MSFTANSARLHREKQIQNTGEKENSNIQKLKNARKGKKSDFLKPSLAKTSTEIARQAKKDKKHAQEINNLKRQYGKSQKKIENWKKNGNDKNRSPTPLPNNKKDELLNEKIENSRKTYYGQPVLNIINGTKDIFEYSPRDIAYALHLFNSLPIEKVNIAMNDLKFVSENFNSIVKNFYTTMKVIYLRINPKERTNKLNSHEIHISTGKNYIESNSR